MSEISNLIGKLEFIRDYECKTKPEVEAMDEAITKLSAEPERKIYAKMSDEEFEKWLYEHGICHTDVHETISCKAVQLLIDYAINELPSAEPERVWHPVEKPPAHHKDVIVRGVEAIGNVTVHKVMQWDVDTWRPTNYAPSITWTEWSEI
jgi:hypothetical protein